MTRQLEMIQVQVEDPDPAAAMVGDAPAIGLHVYGGDFFGAERSEWDPETLAEGRYDAQKTMRHFEQANARS